MDEASVGFVETFVIGQKAIYAAEAYVLGLFQLYPTVYFHKATRSAEKIFSELLVRVVTLVRSGHRKSTGLPETHPLVRFANEPEKIENLLSLDDTVVLGSLPLFCDSIDAVARELAVRLRDRKLYKAIDVRRKIIDKLSTGQDHSPELEQAINVACASVAEKVAHERESTREPMPRILWDEAEREPYKQLDELKGPLNQIRVSVGTDVSVDLRQQSDVVRAIQTFRLNRAYVRDEDAESRTLVDKLIEEGLKNATRKPQKARRGKGGRLASRRRR